MKERNLGLSGLRVSTVGLGCNSFGRQVDLEHARPVIHKALDVGMTFLDCGDVYGRKGGAENILGEVLGARRKDVVLATKFGRPMDPEGRLQGGSRRYIMTAVEASLKRLKTDWIDLYQYHKLDPLTPLEETLRALDDLVHQGKVRYVGCSIMPTWCVVDAAWTARTQNLSPFIACEAEYSLLDRRIEADLLPAMTQHNVGLLPFYPLASGLLTGKYKRDAAVPADSRFAVVKDRDYTGKFMTESNWAKIDKLNAFADERGHSLLDVAVSWLAAKPIVGCVIAGATKPEQVEANAKAGMLAFSPQELAQLDAITAGK
jgi:aryl-alcohol dehydrogenase-like predicted oxidoreductase